MKKTGAEIVIKLLEKQGINIIAGIPGGANLPIYDALHKSNIKHILARHEQGAGFIAHGIARTTGKAAVCIATSGPGATNLITAIADAKLDSIPIIAITGQVPSSHIGTDSFQEVDTFGITAPITKHNYLIKSVNELFEVIPEAFHIAESGRPGPVVIDIPKDIQKEIVEFSKWPKWEKRDFENQSESYSDSDLNDIANIINASENPVIIAGGGIINADAAGGLYQFSKKNSIPVTCTLMGLGTFPTHDSLYIGMLGMHGKRYTNYIINKADLIIAMGTRFDDRATGKVSEFCKQAVIIHIDIDDSEINKIIKSTISINMDIKQFIISTLKYIKKNKRPEWNQKINETRTKYISRKIIKSFHPINIIKTISEIASENTIITTDVGQHQMWVAQAYPFKYPRTFLTSGGLGTMGFGIPAAIGAGLVNTDKQIICISGDGSFFMNMQELATLAEYNLNVKIFIFNNGHLGLVRQQQEMFYDQKYIACKFNNNPDFNKIGNIFGIKSYTLNKHSNIKSEISDICKNGGAALIDIKIHHNDNVTPIVPPGKSNIEMIGE